MLLHRILSRLLVLAAVALIGVTFALGAGCSSGADEPGDASITGDASPLGDGQFGDPCVVAADCDSNVCHDFGQLGPTCTLACDGPQDCPEGSEGQKCNLQGVCRP